eukprot:1057441-Prorocentrum_minimum.AAC.2
MFTAIEFEVLDWGAMLQGSEKAKNGHTLAGTYFVESYQASLSLHHSPFISKIFAAFSHRLPKPSFCRPGSWQRKR